MYGYDSPEMKPSRSDPNRDEIKKKAKYAKKLLEEKILNKIVILQCGKWDKYGRLLGTIYVKGGCLSKRENVNVWMVDNNLGKPYFGGKKE
jgi:endonuclease YncB( thermonuclease family)